MISTISNIGEEINQIIVNSRPIPAELSKEEITNRFLDRIIEFKKNLLNQTEKIKKLDKLYCDLTWFEILNEKEENLLLQIIKKTIIFHKKAIVNYSKIRRVFLKNGICKEEISEYKAHLDDLEDTILEVQEIFFNLRKDDEFNSLINSL